MWTSRVVGIESLHQAAWLIELTHQYFFPVSCFHAVVPPGQRTKTEPFVDSALTVCFDCSWKMTCRRRCEPGRSTSQWPRPLASIVKRRSNVALWALAPSVFDSSTDESPEHFLLALTVDTQTLGPARRFRTSEPPPGSINVEQTRLQSVGQETRCPSKDGSGRHPTNGDNDPEQPLIWLFLSPPSAGVPALESSSPVHDANDPIVPVPAPCLESPGCC